LTGRSNSLHRSITFGVILSVSILTLVTNVSASVPHHAARGSSHKGSITRCVKRNKATGTIKYSDFLFPDTFNPYDGVGLTVTAETSISMFDDLWRYNNRINLFPMMLTTIPTIKNGGVRDGGRTIVLHLKHGLRWSNDAEITSYDIKFALAVNNDMLTGPACTGSCDAIKSIGTPDRYTAIWHMKRVYASAIPDANPGMWPTKWPGAWNNDPHQAAVWLTDAAHNFEGTQYPTNGPYQIVQFVRGDRIILHPMKYYSDMNCGAYLKNLIFALYSDENSMIAAAAQQQTDATQSYMIGALPELRRYTNVFHIHTAPSFLLEHLELNQDPSYHGQPNPLSNAKVRVALALALDKLGMIRSAMGISASVARSIEGWSFMINSPRLAQPFTDRKLIGQWDPIARKYQVNTGNGQALTDAKKLLTQTPYKAGFNLDYFTTQGPPTRVAQEMVIASNWKRLGVTLSPHFVPATKLFSDWDGGGILHHGDFQVADYASGTSSDVDAFKYSMQSRYVDRRQTMHSAVDGNNAGISSPTIDANFKKAAGTFDDKKRARYYALIQREVNERADWITLYFRLQITTEDGRIAHYSNNPAEGPEWNTYGWRRVTVS
jgi:ABC-type transport system substrate-binding protein